MDYLDLGARLPPRKRLLAGLKKKDPSDCNLSLLIPSIQREIYDRLHKIVTSSSFPVEQIIEEVNLVASDAAATAVAARANAMGKAEAAAKAKIAAKSALELVDLIRERYDCIFAKNKFKKRRIEINHLYEDQGLVETDEKLAHRLQRAMNGSVRISKKLDKKKHDISRKLGSEIVVGKKTKVRRKKLLLSQFSGKNEDLMASVDNAKQSNDDGVSMLL